MYVGVGVPKSTGVSVADVLITTANYTVLFPLDVAGVAHDFIKNYKDMRAANWKNSDKYFHAKANFMAAGRGPGGEFFAIHFSNLREIWDQNVKGYPRSDSELDQKANRYGRQQSRFFEWYDYKEAIELYRPNLLPLKY